MKYALIFLLSFATTTSTNNTVDTYDWSAFETTLKIINEAISTTVDAHLIIHDDFDLKVDNLPQKSKSQLAILHDAAYRSWLTAETELGSTEAAKYWDRYKMKRENNDRLKCTEDLMDKYYQLLPAIFSALSKCKATTITACHLDAIQQRIDTDMAYQQCIKDKYGTTTSPLQPRINPNGGL